MELALPWALPPIELELDTTEKLLFKVSADGRLSTRDAGRYVEVAAGAVNAS
jgi:hypothetical protein